MSSASDLVSEISGKGVKLWLAGSQLRYRAPKGVLTDDLIKRISACKGEIVDFLERMGDPIAKVPPLRRQPRPSSLPLSYAQERLWFLEQLGLIGSAYNISTSMGFAADVHVEALRRSLQELIRRHESLRTRFETAGGHAVQVIDPPGEFELEIRELPALRGADERSAVQRLIQEHATHTFDLAKGPLFKVSLLKTSEQAHVLLLVMHHIVSDGWSMGVMVRELSMLYNAFTRGLSSPLAELPLQYVDYALWQRQWLQEEELDRQLQYWKAKLQGAPPILDLPTDRVRPRVPSFRGAVLPFGLSRELSGALSELSRREGVTLYMLLLAGFQVLLSRYSGQEDIVVGSPIAGRTHPQIEGLIGFFLNTLVMRTDLSGNPSFRELLQRVKEVALGAYAHQDLPFEKLVADLQPERNLSSHPLFQVMLVLQNLPRERLDVPKLGLRMPGSEHVSAKFDLSLRLSESRVGLRGVFEYATDLFDRSSIERLVGHFQKLLREISVNPDSPISQLRVLSTDEWEIRTSQRASSIINRPFELFDRAAINQSIISRFDAQVAKNPHAIAIADDRRVWSFEELDCYANGIAEQLLIRFGSASQRIALLFKHEALMVIAMFGVLKAGMTYVPLDPTHPAERLRSIIDDSESVAVLVGNNCLGLAGQCAAEATVIDATTLSAVTRNPRTERPPEALAYILYTSGTTGRPKGVVQNDRNVLHFIAAYTNALHLANNDRLTLFASYAFDAAVMDIYGALLNGASVHLWDVRALGVADLVCWLRDKEITVWHSTPTLLRLAVGSFESTIPASIRLVVLGGEEAGRHDSELVRMHFPPECLLVNGYGPTESTVSMQYFVNKDAPLRSDRIPIGRPVEATDVVLLGPNGLPTEFVGEIGILSPYVALEYWKDEDQTARAFSAADKDGRRLYRSGDLARYMPDGNLVFLGRADNQVKIRGFRIELAEIEAALLQQPQVKQAVVLTTEEKRLIAYVVSTGAAMPGVAHLREHLRHSLPDYMIPAAFVVLEALPLTPNGKLDRGALPTPDSSAYATREYRAPSGEIEPVIAGIWQELLHVDRVGRHDNFFELGGHSLLAVTLMERMQQQGLHADVRAIFDTQTLGEFAGQVGSNPTGVEVPASLIDAECTRITPELLPLIELEQADIDQIVSQVPGGAGNVQDIYPLAPLQQGILFHHLMASGGDPYVFPRLLAFDTRERLDRFIEALQSVIDRHDALRTGVLWEGLTEPVQVVWRQAKLPVEERVLSSEDAVGEVRERFDARHYRFDVRRAPLQRACIAYDKSRDRWLLMWLSHHLVFDHTTLEIVFSEVQAHLRGEQAGLGAAIPYRNYVAQARLGISAQEHEQFFKERLGDIEEPTAPFGLTDVRGDGRRIIGPQLVVAPQIARGIRRCARMAGVSAASVCHLAWAKVLSRLTGREEVVFGTVLLGRMQGGEGADQAVGLLINTLPLRVSIGGQSVQHALRATHEQLGQLIRHEHATLAQARRCSAVPAPTPLFTTLLNYRYQRAAAESERRRKAFEGGVTLYAEERTNYPLGLVVNDLGEGFSLDAQVHRSIDPQRICALMHAALSGLVEALESAPQTAVRSIDVLSAADDRALGLHASVARRRPPAP